MEAVILALFKVLESSGGISVAISIATLAFGGFLYFKKTNIEQVTSVGHLQQENIKNLLNQIEVLSDELSKARKQIAEIHEQNLHLMEQVRESNRKIQELEQLLGVAK